MVVHPDSGRITRVRPYSGYSYVSLLFRLRGSHPLWPAVPGAFSYRRLIDIGVLQPRVQVRGLGCSRFARHYYGNLFFDFFSPVTEMFQFTEYTFPSKDRIMEHNFHEVSPFGHLRFIAP